MSGSYPARGLLAAGRQSRVVIPVRVAGKRFTFAYGDRMPALVDGARADVVVECDAVEDKYLLNLLQTDQAIALLQPQASVLIAVRPSGISQDLLAKTYDHDKRLRLPGCGYVETHLTQPLRLRLSGSRRAAFSGGHCEIPALDNRRAISLNQAYTFISEVFEPERQSHVGNAFLSGLFYNDAIGAWSRLEDLRTAYELQFQKYITEQCAVKSKRRRLAGPPTFEEWLDGKRQQTIMEF